jgi:hypothetical protein
MNQLLSANVLGLYITDAKDKPMTAVESVQAMAERGLVGDRYFLGTGTYSNMAFWGANVTLIQSEAIQAVNVGHETDYTGAMLRRNIVTGSAQPSSAARNTFHLASTWQNCSDVARYSSTSPTAAESGRRLYPMGLSHSTTPS